MPTNEDAMSEKIKCPHCGFVHEKSKRHVIMEDGAMVEKDGHLVRPRYVKREPDTAQKWASMYWGYKNKKLEKTFKAMEGFFAYEYGYHPPRDLPFMPIATDDWCRPVYKVEMSRLHSKLVA